MLYPPGRVHDIDINELFPVMEFELEINKGYAFCLPGGKLKGLLLRWYCDIRCAEIQ
jgi:hypothetical protein